MKTTEEKHAWIIEKRAAGMSVARIAKAQRMNLTSVYSVLKKAKKAETETAHAENGEPGKPPHNAVLHLVLRSAKVIALNSGEAREVYAQLQPFFAEL